MIWTVLFLTLALYFSQRILLSSMKKQKVLHNAVFSETLEGVHMKYSVNKQQINECTRRVSLSKMATLYTQQPCPYSRGYFLPARMTLALLFKTKPKLKKSQKYIQNRSCIFNHTVMSLSGTPSPRAFALTSLLMRAPSCEEDYNDHKPNSTDNCSL